MIIVGIRAGFSVARLNTTSAVLTAVIGFALQDTLGNLMGGLALQIDNSVRVTIDSMTVEPRLHGLLFGYRDSVAQYTMRYWITDLSRDDSLDREMRMRLGMHYTAPISRWQFQRAHWA